MLFRVFRRYSVKMTPNCVSQIKLICKENQFLRLLVEAGEGCGGFVYKFEVSGDLLEHDQVIEEDGAKLVIDKDSVKILDGAVVEYNQELIRRAFSVKENPNAEMTCGCGSSFSPKLSK
jgi:iron-sulfur cluster assembly accessory protein